MPIFMEEPSMDQKTEVTCPRLHSLSEPELGLLTISCVLVFFLASDALTHGIILSSTQKAFNPVFILLSQSKQSTYVRFLCFFWCKKISFLFFSDVYIYGFRKWWELFLWRFWRQGPHFFPLNLPGPASIL